MFTQAPRENQVAKIVSAEGQQVPGVRGSLFRVVADLRVGDNILSECRSTIMRSLFTIKPGKFEWPAFGGAWPAPACRAPKSAFEAFWRGLTQFWSCEDQS